MRGVPGEGRRRGSDGASRSRGGVLGMRGGAQGGARDPSRDVRCPVQGPPRGRSRIVGSGFPVRVRALARVAIGSGLSGVRAIVGDIDAGIGIQRISAVHIERRKSCRRVARAIRVPAGRTRHAGGTRHVVTTASERTRCEQELEERHHGHRPCWVGEASRRGQRLGSRRGRARRRKASRLRPCWGSIGVGKPRADPDVFGVGRTFRSTIRRHSGHGCACQRAERTGETEARGVM